jgi:alkylhydroperoxidase family enzyme
MLGLSVGLTKSEMSMMGDAENCPTFDAKDRIVLKYAETVTRENRVDDALYAEMAKLFTQDELVDLALTTAFSSFVNRVHATFRTDLDESTIAQVGDAVACALPQRR